MTDVPIRGLIKTSFTDERLEGSVFLVEVGYQERAYRVRYRFENDLPKAAFYFTSINVHSGHKKRLTYIAPDGTRKVLARVLT